MGMSTIISQIIFFSFILVVLTGLFIISKNYLIEDKESLENKKQTLMNELNTRIEIGNITYSAGTITLNITNDGSTTLQTKYLDLYVNSNRIERNNSNRTITVLAPDILNPKLWDPDETIEVQIFLIMADGNHTIKAVAENNAQDTKIFEIT